ncbi:hypothetical protein [Kribbella sp. HUAS MG21]|uniref:Uncharacterized protein n=1 Tax=Kribbella sp. HUAS MG21 TaxID=3160966 RepID=A0AAU7TEA4_9ACTN
MNADLIAAARDLLPNPAHSITSIAKLLGVSPGTLYNHIPDLRELRSGQLAADKEPDTAQSLDRMDAVATTPLDTGSVFPE